MMLFDDERRDLEAALLKLDRDELLALLALALTAAGAPQPTLSRSREGAYTRQQEGG